VATDFAGRLVEGRRRLEPVPESAREARDVVRDLLERVQRPDLVETAGLLVSELVTNAIVHARTPIELEVSAGPDGVWVGVSDRSPNQPVPRRYGRTATTGRGLELVGLMADRHGADGSGEDGKTVWFELGRLSVDSVPGHRPAAADDGDPSGDVMVELRGLPVLLARAWQQHADALLRENLLAQWDPDRPPAVTSPADDAAAGDAFAVLAAALDSMGAANSLPPTVDLDLALRPDTVAHFADLGMLMDHVIHLAEQGLMLASPTQPEIRALRHWICREVERQAAGEDAAPWPGVPLDTEPARMPAVTWDASGVLSSPEAVVAADDVNRIIAASPAAMELLGWDGDLVGRRIVVVIPERFREAHVASFTLHLLTGDTRILGREVVMPARRRDGSEVLVRLTVHREMAADGRVVFTAAMRPA
jgi:PAS domain S-box-containing protein